MQRGIRRLGGFAVETENIFHHLLLEQRSVFGEVYKTELKLYCQTIESGIWDILLKYF